MTIPSLLKQPSAFLPIALSLNAFCIVVTALLFFDAVHQVDEGTAAHLFQLLMVVQPPIMLFFAIKWLPQAPKAALFILGFQVAAAVAAFAPVFIFRL